MTTPIDRLTAALDDAHAATIDPEHAIVRTDDLALVLAVVEAAQAQLKPIDHQAPGHNDPRYDCDACVALHTARRAWLRATLAAITEGAKP